MYGSSFRHPPPCDACPRMIDHPLSLSPNSLEGSRVRRHGAVSERERSIDLVLSTAHSRSLQDSQSAEAVCSERYRRRVRTPVSLFLSLQIISLPVMATSWARGHSVSWVWAVGTQDERQLQIASSHCGVLSFSIFALRKAIHPIAAFHKRPPPCVPYLVGFS